METSIDPKLVAIVADVERKGNRISDSHRKSQHAFQRGAEIPGFRVLGEG
jgi:hypothetical protein